MESCKRAEGMVIDTVINNWQTLSDTETESNAEPRVQTWHDGIVTAMRLGSSHSYAQQGGDVQVDKA